ncbi:hypothetical protein ACJJTC_006966 [Scirpophaga incertulas]
MSTKQCLSNTKRKIENTLAICYKCKKHVDIKDTVLCSTCNNRFELNCDGYPEHTYRLLSRESKKTWKCKVCIANTIHGKKLSSKNVEQIRQTSVTPQLNRSLLDSHILSDSESLDESYSTANVLSKSVDGTLSDIRTFSDMKDTISQLTNELNSTQMELENVILQNNDLHKQINKLTTEITLLKTLCHTPTFDTSASNSSTRKRHITRYSITNVMSEIKSNALSNQILQNCINKKLSKDDILVICIGENDYSIKLVLAKIKKNIRLI